MVETVSQNAQRIRQYTIDEGSLEVEKFLDAVLSIADHIDHYPRREAGEPRQAGRPSTGAHEDSWGDLFPATGAASSLSTGKPVKAERKGQPLKRRIPAEPERDLLLFLLEHADGLEDWQRDVIAIVREESLYFVPQMQTNGSIDTNQDKGRSIMISGAHSVIYSRAPEADRAFFRDVLKLAHVDVGDGWLIFALPPAEVAVHPSDTNGVHELYLMCDDIQRFVAAMKEHNIVCSPVQAESWGLVTALTLPGGGKLGVYQSRHQRPRQ